MSIEDIRQRIGTLRERFVAHPEKAVTPDSPALARLTGELTVTVEGPSGHSVTSDMPKGLGGTGDWPSPGWYLRAGMASCTATAIAMRAAELSVPLQHVAVKVESRSDNRGVLGMGDAPAAPLGALMSIEVTSKGTPREVLVDLIEWSVAHSPVADALKRIVPLDVAIDIA